MEERVFEALKRCKKDIKPFDKTTNLQEDLDFDSFDTLMFISELEDEFNINIDEDHFLNVQTVGDVIEKLRGEGIC